MQAGRGAPPPAPPVRQRGGALAVFPSTLIKKRPSDWTASFDMADSVLPTTAAGRLGKTARRKTTPVPGVRAPCARARRSRAVFRLPAGAARHAKADVPPLWELPIRFRRLAGRGIAPAARRLAGCCRLSAHPWQGAADFGRRPTGGGAGVKGAKPLVPFFGSFLGQARKELAVGRLPTSSTAH